MTPITLATISHAHMADCIDSSNDTYAKINAFCETYGMDTNNYISLLQAWRTVLPLKGSDNKFISIDAWNFQYYHILRGSITGYQHYLNEKKAASQWPIIVTLDYTQPLSADTFKEVVSAEARAIAEKEGGDYFETVEKIKPALLRAILEYSAGERSGFAVFDGKRRYTLLEMFLTDSRYCPPKLCCNVLKISSDNWNAAVNNPLFYSFT